MSESELHATQLQQLQEYDTALLANLLGLVDTTPTHLVYMSNEIRSLLPEVGPTVGLAVTCELDSSSPDHEADGSNDGFWEQIAEIMGPALTDFRPPNVLVEVSRLVDAEQ